MNATEAINGGAPDPRARVASLRLKRATLLEEVAAIEAAPIPIEQAYRNIDAVINDLAGACALNVSSAAQHNFQSTMLIEALRRGEQRTVHMAAGSDVAGFLPSVGHGPLNYLCAFVPDNVRAVLRANLNEIYAVLGKPLAPADKASRLADLAAQIRGIDVDEESAIVEAEQLGIPIDRRADADPLIVLGLDPGERHSPARGG